MRYLFILLLASCLATGSCKSDREISPSGVWADGCAVFTSFESGYRLSGLCCEYFLIPDIKLKRNNSFSTSATFHSFTGAGYSNVPVNVKGKLSKDEKTLDLSFDINGTARSYSLKLDAAIMYCDCFCD